MLERVKYINHLNETLNLDEPRMFVQTSDIHNFSWKVSSRNDKISGFEKGIHSIPVSIIVKGSTEQECIQLCNRLFDVMEKDVLAVTPGKLLVGDYYLKCFAVESKKKEYRRVQGFMSIALKITTDTPYWIKETTTSFGYDEGSEGTNFDFFGDYPLDYTSNMLGKQLNNTGFTDTRFRIVIYGGCEAPGITIAGHLYEVETAVGDNEYLTIDSVNKKITLTHADGTKENCFHLRNRDSYIFKEIPAGVSDVAAGGRFKFDIVLLEERSEPKWT